LKDLEKEGVSLPYQPHLDFTEQEVELLGQVRLGMTNQAIAGPGHDVRAVKKVRATFSVALRVQSD